MLDQITPARNCFAAQRIREPLSLQIPADKPNGVLFALSIASCGVRKVKTDRTGPNISSRAIRCDCETPVKIVGGYQKPEDGSEQFGLQRWEPSISPVSASSLMRASCSELLIAPRSVFLSIGLPIRIKLIRFFSFSRTSS